MPNETEKKEALRKKALGELEEPFGIKALVDSGLDKIENLNARKMNHPFADLCAEKGSKKYIISIKARNKFQKNSTLNAHCTLGSNAHEKASRRNPDTAPKRTG